MGLASWWARFTKRGPYKVIGRLSDEPEVLAFQNNEIQVTHRVVQGLSFTLYRVTLLAAYFLAGYGLTQFYGFDWSLIAWVAGYAFMDAWYCPRANSLIKRLWEPLSFRTRWIGYFLSCWADTTTFLFTKKTVEIAHAYAGIRYRTLSFTKADINQSIPHALGFILESPSQEETRQFQRITRNPFRFLFYQLLCIKLPPSEGDRWLKIYVRDRGLKILNINAEAAARLHLRVQSVLKGETTVKSLLNWSKTNK